MIKVAGKRSSLEDLNARLRAVPGVEDGVFYMPDDAARPMAFAVAPSASKASIVEALRRDLDPVFLPRPLHLVDALPRAANGKITRDGLEALRRRLAAR
jgi:acyl-coenzyme A synthetase/AMP-(fatty) acid ligase